MTFLLATVLTIWVVEFAYRVSVKKPIKRGEVLLLLSVLHSLSIYLLLTGF